MKISISMKTGFPNSSEDPYYFHNKHFEKNFQCSSKNSRLTCVYDSRLLKETQYIFHFFCVGVVYSGEYDVCDVTLSLSVYPHRASLKNMPGHGGNRTW
jgi:hypothetical protein